MSDTALTGLKSWCQEAVFPSGSPRDQGASLLFQRLPTSVTHRLFLHLQSQQHSQHLPVSP